MSTTFHRAIDECVNSEDAFKKIIDLGFTRVLTSGNKSKAIEGLNQLKMLQNKFGNEIIIIPGGGIRSSNIEEIIFETTCKEYHSAAIVDETEQINISELISIKTKMTL
jgi:copper homeostasis protein